MLFDWFPHRDDHATNLTDEVEEVSISELLTAFR